MQRPSVSVTIFSLIFIFMMSEVMTMKWAQDKPRQCYRRHPDYRWQDGEMPAGEGARDPDKKNPFYNKHCSMRIDPGDPSDKAINIERDCALENCTFAETTCVRNTKIQEKNDSVMVILEGCAEPPKEVPDMDEKNEYGMAGKLWEEYCENLLINHMRPVYKVKEYKCYCPNHEPGVSLPCNNAKHLRNNYLVNAGFLAFLAFLLFQSIR